MPRAELAVALDLPSAERALALVDAIGDEVLWYKVGSMLAVSGGPALIGALRERGKSVFLDCKWHDIPNTVAGAAQSAAGLGVSLATVHLAGGRAMLEAAAGCRGSLMKLAGVGVLTSHDAASYGAVVGREVTDLAHEQQRLMEVGLDLLDGFVCSPEEVAAVRRFAGPSLFLVTPGIRLADDAGDDQRRVATPAAAARGGSDLLVVGRPVTAARDPLAIVRAIRSDIGVAAAPRESQAPDAATR